MEQVNNITSSIIGTCIEIHNKLGPGLFESVYEKVLFYKLQKAGLSVQRQVAIPVFYEEMKLGVGFKADLIVEDEVIAELKSVETRFIKSNC